ncbi:transketolase [Sulfurivirga caldicuralii]|uniref:Transketolase n=1 Tax=Sulfurivirga caldicuralii TaxID=364032 RepID=A0A1N6GRB6_9GAMM|nr:transketolase [Sulfurivirga caldicuralii]SIO10037.1 transketolase [Sulfurivirga caldicuralii]
MPTRRDLANAIRALSMDAVQKAKSGHPGAPMGMADIAEVLWNSHMRHNPNNPKWADRDRFVLSNGHGSMLIYSILHLTGYDVSMEDLKQFRQLHSKTPGHPEYGYTPGVETTTGPLGQGITNAVGFALAERTLAATFNRPGHDIVDHYTYVFMGDGCLMEGISHEACSFAGTMGLGKLIAFWDDNNISIDGHVDDWFSEDVPKRFEAYGWHVIRDVDGHDAEAVDQAIREAKAVNDKPTLIQTKTTIGFGAPNLCGTHDCHGAPLGEEEIKLTRENLNWPYAPFEIPEEIYAGWDAREKGQKLEDEWQAKFEAYRKEYPELAAEFERRMNMQLPAQFDQVMMDYARELQKEGPVVASRKASQMAIEKMGPIVPELLGGSADLTPSNLTAWSGSRKITRTVHDGNYISYGVREFGMAHIMNGIVLHGGFRPYGGTFLMFMEYMRNAVRMAALMKVPTIFVYTHDSIGLGEDGPTHQPVEQIATLRVIPNMEEWRPCDAVESVIAWKEAMDRKDGPTCLIFSRQNLQHQQRDDAQLENISKGGYILVDTDGKPDLIIIATGSEVALAADAAKVLAEKGIKARVVSMPSTKRFDAQPQAYKDIVLPADVPKMAVEAGVSDSWYKYVGLNGEIVGMDRFGESAPAGELFKEFGFTVDNVVAHAETLLEKNK